MFSPQSREIYLIGYMSRVRQIQDSEIHGFRDQLTNLNWLDIVENDFHSINDPRSILNHLEFMRCWNSNSIVARTNHAFIVNVIYDELVILPNPLNLTSRDPSINSSWRRLSILYNLSDAREQLLF